MSREIVFGFAHKMVAMRNTSDYSYFEITDLELTDEEKFYLSLAQRITEAAPWQTGRLDEIERGDLTVKLCQQSWAEAEIIISTDAHFLKLDCLSYNGGGERFDYIIVSASSQDGLDILLPAISVSI